MVSAVGSQVHVANTQHLQAASSSNSQLLPRADDDIPVFEIEPQSSHRIARQIAQAKATVQFLQHQRRADSFRALTSASVAQNANIENWQWTHLPQVSARLSQAVDQLNACKLALQKAHTT